MCVDKKFKNFMNYLLINSFQIADTIVTSGCKKLC